MCTILSALCQARNGVPAGVSVNNWNNIKLIYNQISYGYMVSLLSNFVDISFLSNIITDFSEKYGYNFQTSTKINSHGKVITSFCED